MVVEWTPEDDKVDDEVDDDGEEDAASGAERKVRWYSLCLWTR